MNSAPSCASPAPFVIASAPFWSFFAPSANWSSAPTASSLPAVAVARPLGEPQRALLGRVRALDQQARRPGSLRRSRPRSRATPFAARFRLRPSCSRLPTGPPFSTSSPLPASRSGATDLETWLGPDHGLDAGDFRDLVLPAGAARRAVPASVIGPFSASATTTNGASKPGRDRPVDQFGVLAGLVVVGELLGAGRAGLQPDRRRREGEDDGADRRCDEHRPSAGRRRRSTIRPELSSW